MLFKKLIGTVSGHLTDEVRPVALEAYKCGSSLFENKLVNRLLLPYVDDFLHAVVDNFEARKTLVQAKDLAIIISRAIGTSKVAEKLLKICGEEPSLGVAVQIVSFLTTEPVTEDFYCSCFVLLVECLKDQQLGSHIAVLADFIDINRACKSSLIAAHPAVVQQFLEKE